MRKIFPVCCACAGEQSAKSMAQRARTVVLFFTIFCAPSARRSSLTIHFTVSGVAAANLQFADTGAIFSVIPKTTLDQLGIIPYAEETFHLADGSVIRRPVGDVFIRIDGKARTVPTIFGEPTDTPSLEVTALEILGYTIDPRTRKLEPTKMLLL
jgi:predicted aspartyl protease